MFTKGKPEGSSPNQPTPSKPSVSNDAPRQAMMKPPSRSAPSLISVDMKVTGSVISEGEMQIDGKIEGDVKASAVTVGDSGEINGEIIAETIIVRGKVRGHIRARKVQLASTAKVQGDITHSSLSIEANAVFEGQVKHSEDPLRSPPVQPSAPPQAPN